MCLEDIKIMGESNASSQRIAVLGTATQILSPAMSRIGIIFLPHDSVDYWVNIVSGVAVSEGLLIPAQGAPVEFNVFRHGDFCRKPWFAISGGADIVVSVMELSLNTNLARKAGYGEA